jgi:glutamine synthetase
MITPTTIAVEDLPTLLTDDIKVKVGGIDADGILRGKVMAKEKFLGIAEKGFGFSSAVFGWDMHDMLWTTDARIAPPETGYADFLAVPDLNTFRRLPWEDNIPFFLVRFISNGKAVSADGRSMLKGVCDRIGAEGYQALAGGKFSKVPYEIIRLADVSIS